MLVDNKFQIGQTVYLKTDREQLPRIVTELIITNYAVIYRLSQGTLDTNHHDIEISETRNIILAIEN